MAIPTIKQAVTFAHALVAGKYVPDAVKAEREAVCATCDRGATDDAGARKCTICGCGVSPGLRQIRNLAAYEENLPSWGCKHPQRSSGKGWPVYYSPPMFGMVLVASGDVTQHLEARKQFYPDVPLLVIADATNEAVESLSREYGAEFVKRCCPLGPTRGDLAAIRTGLVWAEKKGLDVLVRPRDVPTGDWRIGFQPNADTWGLALAMRVKRWHVAVMFQDISAAMAGSDPVDVDAAVSGLITKIGGKTADWIPT